MTEPSQKRPEQAAANGETPKKPPRDKRRVPLEFRGFPLPEVYKQALRDLKPLLRRR